MLGQDESEGREWTFLAYSLITQHLIVLLYNGDTDVSWPLSSLGSSLALIAHGAALRKSICVIPSHHPNITFLNGNWFVSLWGRVVVV